MRDGRFVAREATKNLTRQQMANLMVGRELSDLFPQKKSLEQPKVLLRVKGLTVPGWAQDVTFDVHAGEILGFAGLVGAGRTELFEGLLGLREYHAETIELDGRPTRFRNPREAADQGLTYLSEDRKRKGPARRFRSAREPDTHGAETLRTTLVEPGAREAGVAKSSPDFRYPNGFAGDSGLIAVRRQSAETSLG